jgi:SNF2 family DNA or RNA helicase
MKRFYKHQLEAFRYSLQADNPALFLDMRLGKILVTLRRINLYEKHRRILIVCPGSAFRGWIDELDSERELAPCLLLGTRKARLALLKSSAKWFIINKEGFLALPEIASINWDAIVLDESTFIKNPKAKVTKFFTKHFREIPHRFALTGTPNPESDLDLFCQMQFLNNSFCGFKNYWDFRAKLFRPVFYDFFPTARGRELINKELAEKACIIKRKDVGINLPRQEIIREIEFDSATRKIYSRVEKDFVLTLANREIKTIWAISQYVWMRQLCGGFADSNYVFKGKMQELEYLVNGELVNEPVIVWFNFNNEIAQAKKLFKDCQTMTGKDSFQKRDQILQDFQAGRVRVLLLQQAVAQTGMDLSKADTAIYFSMPVSLMAYQQTQDRIVRLDKPNQLLLINLIVKDSVDEDVFVSLRNKSFASSMTLLLAGRMAKRNA